jgi:hypothetical protein
MQGAFDHDDLEREARGLWRRMSLTRAATMCGVSIGTVARWRDGGRLMPAMARRVAVGLVASDNGWVGTFGTVRVPDGLRIEASTDSDGRVLVRVIPINDERGGA